MEDKKSKTMKYIIIIIAAAAVFHLDAQEGTPSVIRGNEQYALTIKTIDHESKEIVDETEVYLFTTKTNELVDSKTTQYGLATFEIDPETEYEVRTCNPKFMRNGLSIFECNEGNEVLCSFGADDYTFVAAGGEDKPIAYFNATLALKGLELGSVFEMENVYYDVDEATLRPRGKSELDELVKIMEHNPSITIELSSHTDSRASDEYNMDLSQRRAESCLNYLISKGISKDRIIPMGYGESKLLNECTDGVECNEEQHQRNRRTEIEVLSFEEVACSPSLEIDFDTKNLEEMENVGSN